MGMMSWRPRWLFGALERNLLLLEFMETVMRDAYISQAQHADSYIWSDFLDERSQRDPDICDWKESSKKKWGRWCFACWQKPVT